MTATTAAVTPNEAQVVRMGRIAIATQGVLYVVVGLLAGQIAGGDKEEEASQTGAIQTIAEQPFGQLLLVLLVVGLAAHALWRFVLAARGEADGEDDAKGVAKRLANVGRGLLYLGFLLVAVRILLSDSGAGGGSGGGGGKEKESTAVVLSWPAGPWIVIAAGLAVIALGAWNAKRAATRSFLDALDLSTLDHQRRKTVELLGVAGYAARAVAFALVGWFLVTAGRQHDADETRGLDGALRELVDKDYGPLLIGALALGLLLFGAYRITDALLRRPSEISHA
ncbi:MAG TPA: DUF1206 domain-containing protein [Aquihabitans sp.]|jgi:hypothetical protein|nr:DUF1206 domain-containing protein [Aquihabitans sp.]